MPNHLYSKTMSGLALMLLISVGLCLYGKLTPEMVDVIKWVGGSFMAVRGVANYTENTKP